MRKSLIKSMTTSFVITSLFFSQKFFSHGTKVKASQLADEEVQIAYQQDTNEENPPQVKSGESIHLEKSNKKIENNDESVSETNELQHEITSHDVDDLKNSDSTVDSADQNSTAEESKTKTTENQQKTEVNQQEKNVSFAAKVEKPSFFEEHSAKLPNIILEEKLMIEPDPSGEKSSQLGKMLSGISSKLIYGEVGQRVEGKNYF